MFYTPRTQPLTKYDIMDACRDTRFFRSLPKSLHTPELARAMITADVALDELDTSVWSIDVLRAFARKSGQRTLRALFATPVALTPKQRKQLCHIAVNQSPFAICEIPDLERHDVELCRLATRTGYNVEWVPDKLRTLDMCELALTKRAFSIEEFPLGILTAKHCQTAVLMETRAFQSIPSSFRTPELTRFAIQHAKDPLDVICYIVPHIVKVDDTLVHELVERFGCGVLTAIAQELISDDSWVDLVQFALNCASAEAAVHDILGREYFTKERYAVFCHLAVKARPNAFHYMTDLDLIWELCTSLSLSEVNVASFYRTSEAEANDVDIITFSDKSSVLSPLFWDLYAHFKGPNAATEDAATEDAATEEYAERAKLCATMEFRTDPIVHRLCARLGPHAFSTLAYRSKSTTATVQRIAKVMLPFTKIEFDEYSRDYPIHETVEVDSIAALLSLIREYESKSDTTGLQERRKELESAIRRRR